MGQQQFRVHPLRKQRHVTSVCSICNVRIQSIQFSLRRKIVRGYYRSPSGRLQIVPNNGRPPVEQSVVAIDRVQDWLRRRPQRASGRTSCDHQRQVLDIVAEEEVDVAPSWGLCHGHAVRRLCRAAVLGRAAVPGGHDEPRQLRLDLQDVLVGLAGEVHEEFAGLAHVTDDVRIGSD